ncbi:hypothetical protein Hte_001665 [Hypoxylon texense]
MAIYKSDLEPTQDRNEGADGEKYQGTESDGLRIDPALEKRVRRKIDYHLVPLLMGLYLVAFLDRSNIGNAETAGMSKDLGFDDEHYQWLLTIFYIPYIVFEWAALMWKAVPPHGMITA